MFFYCKYILNIILLLISGIAVAQIEDGSLAPNFVVDDIEGDTHDLYNYLQEGHFVVIYFMATWSDPCWSYHNGAWNGTNGQGAMNVLHNEYSVENGGNVIVLMVEGDPATNTECLVGGPGCNYTTHGNWAMDTPYPLIDNSMIADLYGIEDYPIIMTICPNGLVSESGTLTGAGHWSFIENFDCPALLANDAGLQINPNSSCEETELTVDLLNLGANPLTALNIISSGITPEVNMDWAGSLESFESETINFGFVSAVEGEEMMLSITDIDENMDNNDVVPTLGAVAGSTHIHLELQSDTYPEDFSFYIYNEFGNLVVSDGGWGGLGADVLIERDYFLPEIGCYTVELYDAYGDGLFEGAYCLAYGIDGGGNDMDLILDIQPSEFSEVSSGVNVNEVVVGVLEEDKVFQNFEVYPNPAKGRVNLHFELIQAGRTKMELVTPLGDVVMSKSLGSLGTGSHQFNVELTDVASGFYMIFLYSGDEVLSARMKVD